MNIQKIIISPIITEKAMSSSGVGRYSFIVDKSASKTDIKQAVRSMFKVNVVNIQTAIAKGKRKRIGARKVEVAGPVWKKAIVTLKKGEKIDKFEIGGEKEEKKKKK